MPTTPTRLQVICEDPDDSWRTFLEVEIDGRWWRVCNEQKPGPLGDGYVFVLDAEDVLPPLWNEPNEMWMRGFVRSFRLAETFRRFENGEAGPDLAPGLPPVPFGYGL